MRPSTFRALSLVLAAAAVPLAGCHESELEPQTPDQVWAVERPGAGLEAAYTMSPTPAVFNPAPLPRDRPRSVSLGYIGDSPLTASPPRGPRWPWVQEPFRYRGYGGGSYGRGRSYGYGYRASR
jgi:hypothetical protein